MLNGLYSAASALNVNFKAQDLVAHNLAHVNVPGFKKVLTSIQAATSRNPGARVAVTTPQGTVYRNINGIRIGQQSHDFSQGRLEPTGIPTNVAIHGPGFFQVDANGETLFTRNGDFALNEDNQLSLLSGQLIEGQNGPVTFPDGTLVQEIKIDPQGKILVGDQEIDQIKLVEFANVNQLEQVGTTLFRPVDMVPRDAEDSKMVQFHLESSNTQAVNELIQMIAGMRHFEASQKAMSSISEAIQRHATDNQG